LAKAVNCLTDDLSERPCNQCAHCQAVNRGEFLDLIEIDAASNTSVDDVRDLRDKINFSPNQGRYKVYIIDEVHMLSKPAFNALLKTLEEPPPHAMFILATTEAHKIPITVISRCQRHDFRRISVPEIVEQLETMAAAEDIEVNQDVLGLIARQATGSLRDAISILDQLSSAEGAITVDLAHQVLGTSPDQAVLNFVDAILEEDAAGGFNTIHESAERGNDPVQLTRQVIAYFRNVLLMKMENPDRIDVPTDLFSVIKKHSGKMSIKQLLDLIRIFNNAINDRGASWQPVLPLEMAFLEALDAISGGDSNTPGPSVPDKTNLKASKKKTKATSPQENPPQTEKKPRAAEDLEEQPMTVMQAWKEILERVRDTNPATQGILNSCQPLGIKDNQLVLSFRSEAIKGKMEKGDHQQICQDVIEKVIGVKMPILCIVGGKDQSELPEGVDPDGLVAAVVRDLGGTYVSDQDEE
jgi:DNA polymerase-3 subunit gamma/tau